MLGQAAQATISYLKLPQGNSCFPDVSASGWHPRATATISLLIYD